MRERRLRRASVAVAWRSRNNPAFLWGGGCHCETARRLRGALPLLGAGGVLTLRAVREWQARVPCPNRGRRRVVTREVCVHCGAGFGEPRAGGIELFGDAG